MTLKHEKRNIMLAGLVIGVIASLLVLFGNPKNMGFCIACFLRDIAGACGLHNAAKVQYVRPEIIGLVLGALAMSLATREFRARAGSAPAVRFVLGGFVMIGALAFLGCPLRMVLRLGGGDLNALVGLIGFTIGICIGIVFLKKGFTLGRSYEAKAVEGGVLPIVMAVLLILVLAVPALFKFSEEGPGSKHAPFFIALVLALIVGALAQRTRLCMVGGIRDVVLFREPKLLMGFGAILVSALICNLILTAVTGTSFFHLGFAEQPIAHTDGLWNCLGMLLVGFGCVLLGGCPLRQLVLSGEGNSDSAVTVLGLIVGAAFAHNFGLASSANGPTGAGKIAVIVGIVVVALIACLNTFKKK